MLELKHIAKRLEFGLKYKLPITSERLEDYVSNCGWHFTHDLYTAIEAGYDDAIELSNIVLTQKSTFIAIEDNELFLGQMVTNLGNDEDDVFLKEVKPILFPLSCLDKEIAVNGETFVPIIEILKSYCFNTDVMSNDEILSYGDSVINVDMSYEVAEMLHKWHIDYEKLIEKGLAISVFDLPENPYK